jgi:hypothetical protein
MKATGAEIKEFWDAWPPGSHWYADDGRAVYDGDTFLLEPDEKYHLDEFGVIIFDDHAAKGHRPSSGPPASGEDFVPFEKWFKFWKKTRTMTPMGVVVPNADVDTFKALCKEHGWKVIS